MEKRKTSLTIMTEYVRYMFVYMALSGFHSVIINDIRCAKEQSRKQINFETNFLIFVAKKIICYFFHCLLLVLLYRTIKLAIIAFSNCANKDQ
jgi:hypothetical protein